jgi:outer membrane immunogenic protein
MPKLFHAITSLFVLLVGAVCANAADMRVPVKAPPPAPPPFSWTGFYIGGNVGGAWANTTVTDSVFGLNFSRTSDAVFVGGGQVGGNYEFSNNVVVGVEGDFDWAANNNNNNATVVGPPPLFHTFTASVNDKWMATVAGRLGYAFDRWMIYAKGGGGWIGANGFTVTDLTTGASVSGGSSQTASGWLVGGGFEYAFANNWTVRAEYDYFGLSSRSVTIPINVPIIGGDTFSTGRNNIQMATVGINFLFGGTRY